MHLWRKEIDHNRRMQIANAAIIKIIYQMIYPSEPNSERFNLFLRHVFVMY